MEGVVEVSVQLGVENGGGAEVLVMDVDEASAQTPPQKAKGSVENEKGSGRRKKYVKRKRSVIDEKKDGNLEDKDAVIARCRQEIDDLLRYFRESLVPRLEAEDGVSGGGSSQAVMACMMEGSGLPASKLAEEIGEKIKGREGVTAQSLQADLTFLGSRIRYGVDNGSSGPGEDESELCLWCWEARDISLLPKSRRGYVKCLRKARKKVHDRIDVLSATIEAISKSDSQDSYKSVLSKASERLKQECSVVEIHSIVEKFIENMNKVLKEIKINVGTVKIPEDNKQDVEKQKKRKDIETQKEKTESEKELKRLKEADKEERRREKEEVELKKRLKRQQDEAEREQKLRAKEEAVSKKQASLRKQATIMERFLKFKGNNDTVNENIKSCTKESTPKSSEETIVTDQTVTSSMDSSFSHSGSYSAEDLCKSHFVAWRKCRHLNRSQCWGIRCKPKSELIKEIKLHGSSSVPRPSENVCSPNKGLISSMEIACDDLGTMPDELEKNLVDGPSCNNDIGTAPSSQLPSRTKKLLQFDKSNKPAYYGTWSKKSSSVGPRRPFQRDPDLDYDVDSDDEWEEEEPGESLTDCDKDDEEIDDIKANSDDESEDGFFVPDGYLSDNEGAHVDASSSDEMDDEARSLSNCPTEVDSGEFRLLLQQKKDLHRLTEKALQRSQPLIISNLMHEKSALLLEGDASGMTKIEDVCLRALCMQVCPAGPVIEISVENEDVEEEICQSKCKSDASPAAFPLPLPDSDLPEIVKTIQSCPHGMSKVVELLQQKFPALSKSLLKNKVREISEFVDNHWKVKKEILDRLGLSPSPEKSKKLPKGIATFFSKRCLPRSPTAEPINISNASPSPLKKTETMSDDAVHECSSKSAVI